MLQFNRGVLKIPLTKNSYVCFFETISNNACPLSYLCQQILSLRIF